MKQIPQGDHLHVRTFHIYYGEEKGYETLRTQLHEEPDHVLAFVSEKGIHNSHNEDLYYNGVLIDQNNWEWEDHHRTLVWEQEIDGSSKGGQLKFSMNHSTAFGSVHNSPAQAANAVITPDYTITADLDTCILPSIQELPTGENNLVTYDRKLDRFVFEEDVFTTPAKYNNKAYFNKNVGMTLESFPLKDGFSGDNIFKWRVTFHDKHNNQSLCYWIDLEEEPFQPYRLSFKEETLSGTTTRYQIIDFELNNPHQLQEWFIQEKLAEDLFAKNIFDPTVTLTDEEQTQINQKIQSTTAHEVDESLQNAIHAFQNTVYFFPYKMRLFRHLTANGAGDNVYNIDYGVLLLTPPAQEEPVVAIVKADNYTRAMVGTNATTTEDMNIENLVNACSLYTKDENGKTIDFVHNAAANDLYELIRFNMDQKNLDHFGFKRTPGNAQKLPQYLANIGHVPDWFNNENEGFNNYKKFDDGDHDGNSLSKEMEFYKALQTPYLVNALKSWTAANDGSHLGENQKKLNDHRANHYLTYGLTSSSTFNQQINALYNHHFIQASGSLIQHYIDDQKNTANHEAYYNTTTGNIAKSIKHWKTQLINIAGFEAVNSSAPNYMPPDFFYNAQDQIAIQYYTYDTSTDDDSKIQLIDHLKELDDIGRQAINGQWYWAFKVLMHYVGPEGQDFIMSREMGGNSDLLENRKKIASLLIGVLSTDANGDANITFTNYFAKSLMGYMVTNHMMMNFDYARFMSDISEGAFNVLKSFITNHVWNDNDEISNAASQALTTMANRKEFYAHHLFGMGLGFYSLSGISHGFSLGTAMSNFWNKQINVSIKIKNYHFSQDIGTRRGILLKMGKPAKFVVAGGSMAVGLMFLLQYYLSSSDRKDGNAFDNIKDILSRLPDTVSAKIYIALGKYVAKGGFAALKLGVRTTVGLKYLSAYEGHKAIKNVGDAFKYVFTSKFSLTDQELLAAICNRTKNKFYQFIGGEFNPEARFRKGQLNMNRKGLQASRVIDSIDGVEVQNHIDPFNPVETTEERFIASESKRVWGPKIKFAVAQGFAAAFEVVNMIFAIRDLNRDKGTEMEKVDILTITASSVMLVAIATETIGVFLAEGTIALTVLSSISVVANVIGPLLAVAAIGVMIYILATAPTPPTPDDLIGDFIDDYAGDYNKGEFSYTIDDFDADMDKETGRQMEISAATMANGQYSASGHKIHVDSTGVSIHQGLTNDYQTAFWFETDHEGKTMIYTQDSSTGQTFTLRAIPNESQTAFNLSSTTCIDEQKAKLKAANDAGKHIISQKEADTGTYTDYFIYDKKVNLDEQQWIAIPVADKSSLEDENAGIFYFRTFATISNNQYGYLSMNNGQIEIELGSENAPAHADHSKWIVKANRPFPKKLQYQLDNILRFDNEDTVFIANLLGGSGAQTKWQLFPTGTPPPASQESSYEPESSAQSRYRINNVGTISAKPGYDNRGKAEKLTVRASNGLSSTKANYQQVEVEVYIYGDSHYAPHVYYSGDGALAVTANQSFNDPLLPTVNFPSQTELNTNPVEGLALTYTATIPEGLKNAITFDNQTGSLRQIAAINTIAPESRNILVTVENEYGKQLIRIPIIQVHNITYGEDYNILALSNGDSILPTIEPAFPNGLTQQWSLVGLTNIEGESLDENALTNLGLAIDSSTGAISYINNGNSASLNQAISCQVTVTLKDGQKMTGTHRSIVIIGQQIDSEYKNIRIPHGHGATYIGLSKGIEYSPTFDGQSTGTTFEFSDTEVETIEDLSNVLYFNQIDSQFQASTIENLIKTRWLTAINFPDFLAPGDNESINLEELANYKMGIYYSTVIFGVKESDDSIGIMKVPLTVIADGKPEITLATVVTKYDPIKKVYQHQPAISNLETKYLAAQNTSLQTTWELIPKVAGTLPAELHIDETTGVISCIINENPRLIVLHQATCTIDGAIEFDIKASVHVNSIAYTDRYKSGDSIRKETKHFNLTFNGDNVTCFAVTLSDYTDQLTYKKNGVGSGFTDLNFNINDNGDTATYTKKLTGVDDATFVEIHGLPSFLYVDEAGAISPNDSYTRHYKAGTYNCKAYWITTIGETKSLIEVGLTIHCADPGSSPQGGDTPA